MAVEDTITEVVSELLDAAGDREVSGIGVGAAGFVDSDRELVMFSPHLAWRREPLRKALADRLSRDVLIDNDANGAAWAEWRFGAGRGEPRLVCITLGTGIGGGLVVDGRLERGRFGMAGEFGHMVLVPGGLRCECGNRGCWEQYASGNALGREGRELAEGGSPVAAELLARAGGDPSAVLGSVVTQAALDGDPASVEIVREVGEWLGLGVANLAAALDPGTVVVGGGVSRGGRAAARVRARVVLPQPDRPRLPTAGPTRVRRARPARGARGHGRPRPVRGGRVTAPATDDDLVLRVMTWNVRDLLGDPFAVTRVLRASRADVVCLQEAPRWPGSRGRLASLASRAGLFFVDGGRVSAGTALLVSLRTQVSDVHAARLPVRGWRTRPRGYVRAQVATVRSRPLQVTCLHLGLDEDERARHVGLVLDDLPPALTDAPGSVPVVLAGDLNERPDGPPGVRSARAPPTAGARHRPRSAPRRRGCGSTPCWSTRPSR